jgi:hypothetical protein
MPGNIQGLTTLGPNISKRPDRWLNFRFAFPPERDIRDREDSPGAKNPYNLWGEGDCIGDETIGEAITKLKVYDDDLKLGGTKAFSYTIQGQCLDSAGSPVPGATVELWLSNPEWAGANQPLLIGMTTADAEGKYGFAVPNTVTKYFVVAYISSKGGVTVRNLVGA